MHVTVGELIGNFILIAGSFILLLVLIKKFAWSNITGIFEERAEKIASDIDRAEEARQKAEVLAQKREDELAGSRKEAKTIIENAKETAEKSKASILADAKLEAGRLKEKANQEIAQNKAEALQSVKGEVADLTISLAGKIISQNLDGHAHKELIDRRSLMDKKTVKVIEKYSMPFVQLVLEKGEEDRIFSDLTQIKQVAEETGLPSFLKKVAVDESDKEKTIAFFQDSVSPLLQNLIQVLIYNHRANLFYDVLVDCLNRLEKETNRFEVTITSAHPLTDEQKSRLLPLIEKKMSLKVRSVKEQIDESLIGGFVIFANHKTIDVSIKQQLKVVKENLK